ncbi:MAG TPA: hypothetical protein VN661_07840 [Candidatus Acidoferrales bacterium]|nr:hypothetical protein [Candidatus Acidoferrales bacterium]
MKAADAARQFALAPAHSPRVFARSCLAISFALLTLAVALLAASASLAAQELPPPPLPAWPMTIVLPPTVVAGEPATLAVLDAKGKLAPGVQVQIGQAQGAETDSSGRAYFRVPQMSGALIVRGAGASAVAVVASGAEAKTPVHVSVAPVLSLRDRFSICGERFSGDADANRVTINGAPALVLAASPECVVGLSARNTPPGPATISIASAGAQATANATFVAIEFQPTGRLSPGEKSELFITVRGYAKPLRIRVENGSPDVLRFLRGDSQIVRTDGKPGNSAQIAVQAIRSGDFSFRVALPPAPDPQAASRYLRAAEPLAPPDLRVEIEKIARQIERHPRDTRRDLQRISGGLAEGDLRTLIDAARAAL